MDAPQISTPKKTDRDRGAQHTFGDAAAPAEWRSATPWVVAAAAIVIVLLVLMLTGRRHGALPPNQVMPLDPYARNLVVSDLMMSESTSLSGGKSTFLDGVIRNSGSETVAAVGVQVLFANDEGMPPRVETEPLALIRTREPYVDTQPVGVAPLRPGDQREFRLIFESLPANWNTQMPEIHVTSVSAR